jgi:hypothetical protein
VVELSVDGLARSYTRMPPDELLREVRTRAHQIGRLLDGRATLAQRRRLLTAAGWLALLALGTNHLVPSNAWRADELIAAVS